MKTSLLIIGIIVSIFIACEESKPAPEILSSNTKQRQDQNTIDLLINKEDSSITSDAFDLNNAEVIDSALHITVSYSGGCEKHSFDLVWPDAITYIYPPQFDVILTHDGNNDSCEAYPTETLVFDLRDNPLGIPLSDFYIMKLGVVNGSNLDNKVTLNETPSDCSDTFCTEVFATINVTVFDSANTPIALDYFTVTNVENGKVMTREISASDLEMMQKSGSYPLFGDEYVKEFKNMKLDLQFVGFINDEAVTKENYTVSADCCHVFLIAGETTLIVE